MTGALGMQPHGLPENKVRGEFMRQWLANSALDCEAESNGTEQLDRVYDPPAGAIRT